MCIPLPQIALVEKRDGAAGRVDAAEYLMKHPEVRNYMSQIFTSDGAEALNPGMTYFAEPDSYTIAYRKVLSDEDCWSTPADEDYCPQV